MTSNRAAAAQAAEVSPDVRMLTVGEDRIAYRLIGPSAQVPLVLFQRFRGTMDDWDPAFLEALGRRRRLVLLDLPGVGYSAGTPCRSVPEMAVAAAHIIAALGLVEVDALGWSMGGQVAATLALQRPDLVRRLVFAGSSPGGVPGSPPPPPKVWQVAGKPANDDSDFLYLFFPETAEGNAAGRAYLGRLAAVNDRPPAVHPGTVTAQAEAIGRMRGKDSLLPVLDRIQQPVLVANGTQDVMARPFDSFVMAQRLKRARMVLYPKAGHGFLFQLPQRFAAEVHAFLDDPDPESDLRRASSNFHS